MPSLLRRATLKPAAPTAQRIPLAAFRRLYPLFPLGFFCHIISDDPLPRIPNLYPFKSSAAFEADLQWLKANTHLVGYRELQAYYLHHATLPTSSTYLSFDDGFRECYDIVRPLLLKHGIPCIFFLTTDWIDNKGLFFRSKVSLMIDHLSGLPPADREQAVLSASSEFNLPDREEDLLAWLKALHEPNKDDVDSLCQFFGIDITRFLREAKPCLTRSQIVESCRIVMEITGKDQVPFALPFSGDRVSRTMLKRLKQEHPEIGLIFDTKKLRRKSEDLHRIWVDRPVPGICADQYLAYWLLAAYRKLLLESETGP